MVLLEINTIAKTGNLLSSVFSNGNRPDLKWEQKAETNLGLSLNRVVYLLH